MRKMKLFSRRTGAMFLSVTMLTTVITPEMIVKADSPTTDADYEATEESARTITTGTGENQNTWNIVWSDEFNGTELDTSKWSYMIGTGSNYAGDGWGNNEQQYYTEGENAEVTDGNLVITARKNDDSSKYGGKKYTSTRLWTMDDSANPGGEKTAKFTKTYGRIESRIKISNQADNMAGIWPAFWMMPAYDEYGTWASSGELDIMEARGSNNNSVDGTIHYGSQYPNNKSVGGSLNKPTALEGSEWADFNYGDYHTYAVEWVPGEIRWYVDDDLYYKTSNWYSIGNGNATNYTYPAPFDQDFYILLNLAVGGNYDSGALDENLTEAKMYVDYVRVYDLDGGYDGIIPVKPSNEAASELISGSVGDNYVSSSLADIQTTTGYPDETDKTNWFLSNLTGGVATGSMEDDALKINVTNAGSNDYSIQLIHNVPLTKGWRYVMTFKAKADSAMTLTSKFGNIGGYPAYSDTYNVNLGTEWKEYTYVFDMPADKDSDADGRIEFNMNYNTGNIYFKDFSIVSTGQTPEIDEDGAKEPLSGGNHVYNGTFDQGDGRTAYWHEEENTTISVDAATKDLKIVGTDTASGVSQKGMKLLQNDGYKVEFDAKAETAGTVTVKLLSKDLSTVYGSQDITIGTDYTAEKYTAEFTMQAGVSDTEGVIQFVTGNNTVYLDNVSLLRTTNNNLDWDGVNLYPISNSDFYDGITGWNIWQDGDGWRDASVNENGLFLNTAIAQNGNFYSVGMESPAIDLKAGIPYKLVVDVSNVDLNGPDTEGNGEGTKTLKVMLPDENGTQTDYTFNAGSNEPLEIPFTLTSDVSGKKAAIYFGANSATEYGNFSYQIRRMQVVVDTDKVEIPAEYNKLKPASITSAGAVKEGKDAVIKHNDDAWAAKITTAYVNGTAIDGSLVDTSQSGKVIIKSSALPAEGIYAIKFDAEGYATSDSISQKILPGSENVVANGDFSSADGWSFYGHNGCGTFSVVEGVGVIDFVWHEGEAWHQQLNQEGIKTEEGDYLVSFDAYATIDRPIIVCVTNNGVEKQKVIDITTERKTYYVPYKNLVASTGNKLGFWTGNVDNRVSNDNNPHKIYIDNVKMERATQEDIDAITAPAVSATKTAYAGKSVVFSYTENSIWEQKAITVTVNGTEVAADKYRIDTAANTIAIDGTLFAEAGRYTIAVVAEGYDPQNVQIYVAADKSNILPDEWSTVWKEDGEKSTITTKPYGFDVDFEETFKVSWDNGATYDPEFWSMQAKMEGLQTSPSKTYVLSFDAELTYDDPTVTDDRELTLEFGSNANQPKIAIKPGKDHYEYEVTPGANGSYYVSFLPGGTSLDVAAHTLSISNITFAEKITGDEVDAETPSITTQPTDKTYTVGDAVTALAVAATVADGGSLSYQWYQNTVNSTTGATAISGATSASYMPSVEAEGTTYYFCKVTNTNLAATGEDIVSVDSSIAAIVVTAKTITPGDDKPVTPPADDQPTVPVVKVDAKAPVISKNPASKTTVYKAKVTVSVTAASADGGTLSYQWYKNTKNSVTGATAISGAKSASYTVPTTKIGTTYYFCKVTNTNSKATGTTTATADSKIAKIVVNKAVNPITKVSKYSKAVGSKLTLKPAGSATYSVNKAGKKVVSVTKAGKVTFKSIGTATITVKAKGNAYYKAATKKIKITVTPKKATVSSVKSTKSKTAVVKWKKDAKATGYQIQYSTSSKFKSAKTTTVKKNSTTSTTLKKLKAGKKYYVRVREYKKVGKTTIYGDWSKTKTVKVKK